MVHVGCRRCILVKYILEVKPSALIAVYVLLCLFRSGFSRATRFPFSKMKQHPVIFVNRAMCSPPNHARWIAVLFYVTLLVGMQGSASIASVHQLAVSFFLSLSHFTMFLWIPCS